MTNQYSQEQVDEIGVFMANKLNESNQALKDFLQEKIDNLVPVVPEPPETGEPVVPPATGGAGMFLDDGREIKQKLLTGGFTTAGLWLDHGLDVNKIISVTGIITNKYGGHVPLWPETIDHNYRMVLNKLNVSFSASDGNALGLVGGTAKALITYLA